MNWRWNEFRQTGRNYGDAAEVGRYDKTHADFRDTIAEATDALDLLDVRPDWRLLDIGCGTGAFAVTAAMVCREIIGIDVSEPMLSVARLKASCLGLTNVGFKHQGFLSYEHAGLPLDAVATTFALHHLPCFWQAVALRRIHGMLAPGGYFLLCDVVISDGARLFEPIESFIDEQARAGGDFLREDAEGHFRDEFSTFDWVIEGMLVRAGFTILKHHVKSHVISTYLCRK